MDPKLIELWAYYGALSECLGREQTKDGEITQAPYSLRWFFSESLQAKIDRTVDQTLLLAFLGDMDAQDKLRRRAQAALPELDGFSWPNPARAPNDSQLAAIRAALGYPISFIQGPPGTGKTATILNLLAYIQAQGQTAAVVSSNNEALRNIIDSLGDYGLKDSVAELGPKKNRQKFWEKHTFGADAEDTERGADPIANMSFHDFRQRFQRSIITSTLHSLQKCFSDGTTFQYDYVIIDEASQASVLQGMIALSSARHLVIVGDEKQLTAFISNNLQELASQEERISPLYRIDNKTKAESNFLSLALKVFLGIGDDGRPLPKAEAVLPPQAKTFLAQHYRCHPNIIKFCSQSFYDGKLEITKGEGLPMRILWYDGNYCEAFSDPQGQDADRRPCNKRQVELFVRDEWPLLQKRIPELQARLGDEPLKICVLSPFRRELELLKEELERTQAVQERVMQMKLVDEEVSGNEDEGDRFAMLTFTKVDSSTVHKAQGKEFHIVYLLPTEDAANWEYPWSQGGRLVNVAVSRAMWELCVISSSLLMSDATRAALGCPPLEPHQKLPGESPRQLYIQKLIDYARETGGKDFLFPGDKKFYGFHKTRRPSIFDDSYKIAFFCRALFKADNRAAELRKQEAFWAPQRIVEQTLWRLCAERDLLLYKEVPLDAFCQKDGAAAITREAAATLVNGLETEEQAERFLKHARLDFVICDKARRPLLIVEADGAYHRHTEDGIRNDQLKDDILRRILNVEFVDAGKLNDPTLLEGRDSFCAMLSETKAGLYFLRLPSNGSSFGETNELRKEYETNADEAECRLLRQTHCTIEDLLELAQQGDPRPALNEQHLAGLLAGEDTDLPNNLFYDWIIWEALRELEHSAHLTASARDFLRRSKQFKALLRGSDEELAATGVYKGIIDSAKHTAAFGALPLANKLLHQRLYAMEKRKMILRDKAWVYTAESPLPKVGPRYLHQEKA